MGNIQPIFSRVGNVQSGYIQYAAADYVGQNVNNSVVFVSDSTNGGYIQRLRFKATGTVIATVARIYINNGNGVNAPSSNTPASLTGSGSGSGGALLTSNFVARVASVDQWGVPSAWSTESANVAVTGPTGSITWNWNASGNSNTYILAVGKTPGSEERAFQIVGANTYTMTAVPAEQLSTIGSANNSSLNNNYLYGELSLPAITGSQTLGTQDIDYPLNFALPPGFKISVGLGTTTNVANGWIVTSIAGAY